MLPGEPDRGGDRRARQPHVVLDLPSRAWKARKIRDLLSLAPAPGGRRLLEVGTGSGAIAQALGTDAALALDVDAVDVVDSRRVFDGFRFSLVADTKLPFPDGCFDFVLSNHVIEHVGDRAAQLDHLREVHRVLRPGGRGYLAVPNRWMLVEPHYRIAFLSWLPKSWRSSYLHWRTGQAFYDCEPLTLDEIESLFQDAALRARNRGGEAVVATLRIERPGSVPARIASRVPAALWRVLRRVLPTHIYTFSRPEAGVADA